LLFFFHARVDLSFISLQELNVEVTMA